jgi:hypothetical protein
MAYKYQKIGNKVVAINQTGSGWNVSTYSVQGNKVRTYKQYNTTRLADAQKAYTMQKRTLTPAKRTYTNVSDKPSIAPAYTARNYNVWSGFSR